MISVTKLSSYLYCPRKIYLTDVLKLEEPPKDSLVKGTIRHSTFEKINDIEESIITSIGSSFDIKQVLNLYVRHFSSALRSSIMENKHRLRQVSLPLIKAYREIWPHFMRESQQRSLNIFNFMTENNLFGSQLWASLFPKIKSEIRINSETLELKGIIDQLHVYPDKVIPVELKTGKAPSQGVWPGHKIQVAAYILLFNEKFSTSIKNGIVKYLDYDKEEQITMNPFLKEEIIDIKDKVKALLKSSEPPIRCLNTNKCSACSLKAQCYKL
ncbi:CRISPR-associated protein Cas4 [Candidatus Woesearchaeota archaeon]|nr:CRISPR-associated protein Cas4 [Candidatus Woesearchaeota archaeon]MBW3022239.1 CRISPR-associated protein Cas4 [Candidatus Woesearchaeota archaeon]